jgi:hypothetical protein
VHRSRTKAFTYLVKRIFKRFDAIIAAIELGLSNSRLEGINAKIRLIQRRGDGLRDLDSLTASIYLCPGGTTTNLPTESRGVARMCDTMSIMETVGHWWNGTWGRLARLDVYLRIQKPQWEVELREGGAEGRSRRWVFDD